MFDLTRGIFRSRETAVDAADFITLCAAPPRRDQLSRLRKRYDDDIYRLSSVVVIIIIMCVVCAVVFYFDANAEK